MERTINWIRNILEQRANQVVGGTLLLTVSLTAYLAPRELPFLPPQDTTIAWLCALFFPVTASLFLIFSLQVRLDEVREEADRKQLDRVFFPGDPAARVKFDRLLRRRFHEYYGKGALACFSVLAGLLTLIVAAILIVYWRPLNQGMVAETLPVVAPFAGALAGALVLMAKRFRTFDLYPSSYLQSGIGLICGTLAGSFLSPLWPAFASPLGFACSFLTATNLAFLPRLLRFQFARATGTTMPAEVESDLGQILHNSEAIESVNAIAIWSVSELVKTDPLRLYLNVAQPIPVIDGWFDEALLHYYLPERLAVLREVGVQRFTQLLEMTGVLEPDGGASHAAPDLVAEPRVNGEIARAVKGIVATHDHHRLFGILSETYRRQFFLTTRPGRQLATTGKLAA